MGCSKWVGRLRLLLGVLVAPAVVPVLLWFSLDVVLSWFRPQGSNMAIGMFYFWVVGVAAVAAYGAGIGLGYPYIRRLRDGGRLDFTTFMKGALRPALGLAAGASAIPVLALEFALGAAMAVVTAVAVLLASVCLYLIGCAGRTWMAIDLRD
jgi:hypothetical protein